MREKRENQRENDKKEREKERKGEKKRKKREKERKGEKRSEKDVQGQLIAICIQFSKRKTKYIGRNARNLKKLYLMYLIAHYHYKSSCRS